VSAEYYGTGVSRAGICLPRGPHAAPGCPEAPWTACCPRLPRGPHQATADWSPPSAACAPWTIELSRRVLKIEKLDLPFLPLSFLRALSRALPFSLSNAVTILSKYCLLRSLTMRNLSTRSLARSPNCRGSSILMAYAHCARVTRAHAFLLVLCTGAHCLLTNLTLMCSLSSVSQIPANARGGHSHTNSLSLSL
jgi:hypothetical protein